LAQLLEHVDFVTQKNRNKKRAVSGKGRRARMILRMKMARRARMIQRTKMPVLSSAARRARMIQRTKRSVLSRAARRARMIQRTKTRLTLSPEVSP
jgi:hypothetical protein